VCRVWRVCCVRSTLSTHHTHTHARDTQATYFNATRTRTLYLNAAVLGSDVAPVGVFGSNGVYMGDGTVAIGMDDSYESCLGAIGCVECV